MCTSYDSVQVVPYDSFERVNGHQQKAFIHKPHKRLFTAIRAPHGNRGRTPRVAAASLRRPGATVSSDEHFT